MVKVCDSNIKPVSPWFEANPENISDRDHCLGCRCCRSTCLNHVAVIIGHHWSQGMAPSTFYNVVAIYELMKFLSFKRVGVVYGYRHGVWCELMRHSLKIQGLDRTLELFDAVLNTECHAHEFQQSLNTQTCSHHARMMDPYRPYQFHTLFLWLPFAETVNQEFKCPTVADCRSCQGHQSRSEGSLFGSFGSGTGRISDRALHGPMAVGKK